MVFEKKKREQMFPYLKKIKIYAAWTNHSLHPSGFLTLHLTAEVNNNLNKLQQWAALVQVPLQLIMKGDALKWLRQKRSFLVLTTIKSFKLKAKIILCIIGKHSTRKQIHCRNSGMCVKLLQWRVKGPFCWFIVNF